MTAIVQDLMTGLPIEVRPYFRHLLIISDLSVIFM